MNSKKSVTVASITSVDIRGHEWAIKETVSKMPFPVESLLIQPDPRIVNLVEWSKFALDKLASYVKTDFVLLVHADGYAVNSDKWRDDFLDWDYVGAPWPQWITRSWRTMVGNGGFSLRSHRWLQAAKELAGVSQGEPEDWFCCKTHLEHFVNRGCRIAPVALAMKFSLENRIYPFQRASNSFGVHHPKRRLRKWLGLKVEGWGPDHET